MFDAAFPAETTPAAETAGNVSAETIDPSANENVSAETSADEPDAEIPAPVRTASVMKTPPVSAPTVAGSAVLPWNTSTATGRPSASQQPELDLPDGPPPWSTSPSTISPPLKRASTTRRQTSLTDLRREGVGPLVSPPERAPS